MTRKNIAGLLFSMAIFVAVGCSDDLSGIPDPAIEAQFDSEGPGCNYWGARNTVLDQNAYEVACVWNGPDCDVIGGSECSPDIQSECAGAQMACETANPAGGCYNYDWHS